MSFQAGDLVLLWRGIDDIAIYRSFAFGYGIPLPQAQTSTRPSFAFLPNQHQALMVWPDGSSDSLVWSVDPDFSNQAFIPGAGTSWAACVTPWNGGAIAVWPGVVGDPRIWVSTYGFNGNSAQPWSNPTPALCPTGIITTAITPAICSDPDGNLMMVWRGAGSNDSLYYATSTNGIDWTTASAQIPGGASTVAPALAYFDGYFVLVFKGSENDDTIYSSTWVSSSPNSNKWTNTTTCGSHGTSDGPCLIAADSCLVMAWKGIPGDNNLYYATNNGTGAETWGNQSVIQNSGSSVGPSGYYYVGPGPVL
ncbi:hypothetical protein FTO74_01830 [Granulicella sp. WH15]|uniref:hypothetical protein n=1 Tax=Granulicella sp. WH15 TaxID=2602070 RepID=UPI00136735E9|nr:hypothetical protein [Granulicella sp. WH15]QHN02251.1 hypothetical protein FTO74_01830 [Granulicella sp. WH15]